MKTNIEVELGVVTTSGKRYTKKIVTPYGKGYGKEAVVWQNVLLLAEHWKNHCTSVIVTSRPSGKYVVIKVSNNVYDKVPDIFKVK